VVVSVVVVVVSVVSVVSVVVGGVVVGRRGVCDNVNQWRNHMGVGGWHP
jgi:hypothetical protein